MTTTRSWKRPFPSSSGSGRRAMPASDRTPGVEASKAGTLISGLVAFKRLHDDNALLEEAIPEFFRKRPARYAGVRSDARRGSVQGRHADLWARRLQEAA